MLNMSQMATDMAVFTMADQFDKFAYGLWNGTIFNDQRHSLTLNISHTATDSAIVTIKGE